MPTMWLSDSQSKLLQKPKSRRFIQFILLKDLANIRDRSRVLLWWYVANIRRSKLIVAVF